MSDIGLNHSAGKGDAPRHRLDDNYRANYDEINWGRRDLVSSPHTVTVQLKTGTLRVLEMSPEWIEPEQRFEGLNKLFGPGGWRYINDRL